MAKDSIILLQDVQLEAAIEAGDVMVDVIEELNAELQEAEKKNKRLRTIGYSSVGLNVILGLLLIVIK